MLIEYGTINRTDLELFLMTDSVDTAFDYLTEQLSRHGVKEHGATL